MVTDPRQEVSELELDWSVAVVQQPQRPARISPDLALTAADSAGRGAAASSVGPMAAPRWEDWAELAQH